MRVFLLLLVVAIAACRREDVPQAVRRPQRVVTTTSAAKPVDLKGKTIEFDASLKPPVIDGCRTSSTVNAQAGIAGTPQTEFTDTQTIYTTVWLKESPPGLAMSVEIFDAKGKLVTRARRDANQAKIVTLAVKPLPPGRYKHETSWGGNVVCELNITVVKM